MSWEVEEFLKERFKRVAVDRRGRIPVFTVKLERAPPDPWLFREVHEVKSEFPEARFRLKFVWRSGRNRYNLSVPHNVKYRKIKKQEDWTHPYYPNNGDHREGLRGKVNVIKAKRPPHFHDEVRASVNGKGHRVNLVFPVEGGVHAVEVVPSYLSKSVDEVIKRLTGLSSLKGAGFPVDRVVLYVVPRSVPSFIRKYLPIVREAVRLYRFKGEIWVATPGGKVYHIEEV